MKTDIRPLPYGSLLKGNSQHAGGIIQNGKHQSGHGLESGDKKTMKLGTKDCRLRDLLLLLQHSLEN